MRTAFIIVYSGESEKAILVPVSTKEITGSLMSEETELNRNTVNNTHI